MFVPDSKPLDALLREMQRDRIHMALLVDEYGAIAGLVTIEDVLEEIVGEIADEYDTDEVAPVEDLGDKRYRVSARLPIEDLGELYDIEFDEDLDVDTVGGLVALELGRVPLPGAEVTWDGLRLRAEGGPDHRGRVRIGTVLVSPTGAGDDERSANELSSTPRTPSWWRWPAARWAGPRRPAARRCATSTAAPTPARPSRWTRCS